jgi:hypothetical protein
MWKLVGFLLIAGLIIKYWPIALAIAIVALVVKYLPGMVERAQAATAARNATLRAIAARADEQHHQVLNDDARGIYGAYTPAC